MAVPRPQTGDWPAPDAFWGLRDTVPAMTDSLFGLAVQVARCLTRAGAGALYPARMRSTVLYGLDDADIPQDFSDELDEAGDQERSANSAMLLNALLLAGWAPPSRGTSPSA